ncbi:MAG: carboxypeptidase regulatory-like domain-containing protein [Planctomycetes bacterium]|nr:carboxypeptidase regulatory-like domain-containing protein [Planctomycetota bacterium]
MTRTRVLVATLLAALPVGCSNGGPPSLVPVHGRVTIDGQPLAGKTVQFVPDPGTPGQGAGATTNAAGEYTLLAARPGATRDEPGAPAGAYRVVVVEPMFPVDLPVQDSGGAPTPAIGLPQAPKKKQEIPTAYTKPETTPLRVEVPAGGGAINLALESPPKK